MQVGVTRNGYGGWLGKVRIRWSSGKRLATTKTSECQGLLNAVMLMGVRIGFANMYTLNSKHFTGLTKEYMTPISPQSHDCTLLTSPDFFPLNRAKFQKTTCPYSNGTNSST